MCKFVLLNIDIYVTLHCKVIKLIKSKRMRQVGYLKRTGDEKSYAILVVNLERKRPFGRNRRR